MNRILIMGFALLLMTGGSVVKAQTEAPAATAGTATPEQQKEAEEVTREMTKKYDLNEEQQKAFQLLNLKRVQKLAALRAGYDESKATAEQKTKMKAALAAEQKRYDYVAKELMSDKQYEKYQAQLAKEREKAAEASGENKIAPFGPMVMGENTTNLLGFGAEVGDSMKIAQKQTDKMVKKYKLSAEQSEKLLALNIAEVQAEITERRAMANGSTDMSEMTEAAKKRTANYERYLKEIMTEEQYKKYTNAKKAQLSRRQNWGGPGFGGPRMW